MERVTQRHASPFGAMLRAVAALRLPSDTEGAPMEGAALVADPALERLLAGTGVQASGAAALGQESWQLKGGRKLRQQVRRAAWAGAGPLLGAGGEHSAHKRMMPWMWVRWKLLAAHTFLTPFTTRPLAHLASSRPMA